MCIEMDKTKLRFRLSIRSKLVGIINLIVIVAAGAIVIFATQLFSRDNVARIQESNLDAARLIATEVQNDFTNLTEKMRLIGVTLLQSSGSKTADRLLTPLFEREKDLLAAAIIGRKEKAHEVVAIAPNTRLLKELDIEIDEVSSIHRKFKKKALFSGIESILRGTLKGHIPIITLLVPLLTDDKGNVTHAIVATVKQDRFLKAVKSDSIITSYLVDSKGSLLAHPDQERVLKGENLSHLKIVEQLLEGKLNNGQTRFVDPGNYVPYLGAFKTVGFAGVGVVAQVEEDKALEAARKVRKTSIIITAMVSVVAFLIVFFFSLSLTQPLVRLVDATESVAQGNYDVKVKVSTTDEIGDLTAAFNQMTIGLAEREKFKTAFAKFHSQEVAEKILSGELKLGGERKHATVFFSDVRGFTAMSEKMEPEALVSVLNRYMTRMVRVILEHGGIVDKYVGDAIMALWGVPLAKDGDVKNAVQACLDMRQALDELNTEFKAEGLPTLKMGMGLNYGPLVSGNIGSEERMEFTVIGDTVNTASRIESITKTFGTDCLISQAVLDQVPGLFLVEKAHEAKVKGKADALIVYKVNGTIDAEGKEVRIETPYSSYAAEKSDKVESAHSESKLRIPMPAAALESVLAPVALEPSMLSPVEEAPVELTDTTGILAFREDTDAVTKRWVSFKEAEVPADQNEKKVHPSKAA